MTGNASARATIALIAVRHAQTRGFLQVVSHHPPSA